MTPDVAASVKARLLNRAKASGEEFERTLTRFAAERLLFRLGASTERERCLLKGASLLTVWMPDPYRATRDVDLLAFGDSDDYSVGVLLAGICGVPCPEDGLRFDQSSIRVETIQPEEEYAGKRVRFFVYLGSARISVRVDVGFGDALGSEPEEIEFPTMLESLPAPRIRAYPREASIAEKFQAMVKLDTRNSRMKDFHDLWMLSSSFAFYGPTLQQAISVCFKGRRTPWVAEVPGALTPAFYVMPELATRWRSYLTAGSVLVPPPSQFNVIGERIIGFLGPMRESVIAACCVANRWPPGGPWR